MNPPEYTEGVLEAPLTRTTTYWWTCVKCWDQMQISTDRAFVEYCRDQHILHHHPGWIPKYNEFQLSHWNPRVHN